MKQETLNDALGMMEEEILEETNQIREKSGMFQKEQKEKRWEGRRKRWNVILPAAAVAVLCLTGIWYGSVPYFHTAPERGKEQTTPEKGKEQTSSEGNKEQTSLPKLEISEDSSAAMGFEGYLAYDIGELVSGTPWQEEMVLTTLPVYKNPISYDSDYIVSGGDFEAMEAFLREIAARMGLDTKHLEITDDTPDEEEQAIISEKMEGEVPEGYFNPTKLIAKTDGIRIEVDVSMTATIYLEPAVALPENYHSTSRDSSYEEIEQAAEYLKEKYQTLLEMEEPVTSISGGDYTYQGKAGGQKYDISFYEGSGEGMEPFLQYSFHQVFFHCDTEGKLFLIRMYHPDLSGKIGDYPIISVQEAKELLENGAYVTSVPYEMPGLEYVSRVELLYRTGNHESYFMPFYRFLVELPGQEREGGLKTYGAYYVPAVEGEYISNMPVWDGSFDF